MSKNWLPPSGSNVGKKFGASACLFAVVLLQNWISDGLEGNTIFSKIPLLSVQMGQEHFWSPVMVVLAGLLVLFSLLGYHLGQELFAVKFRKVSPRGEVEPKKHLIFALSELKWKLVSETATGIKGIYTGPNYDNKVLSLDTSLSQNEKMDELKQLRSPVEQIIRGLQPHIEVIDELTFLVSRESASQWEYYWEVISWYFPDLNIKKESIKRIEANFNDLTDINKKLQEIIAHVTDKDNLSIDITGGTKLVSAAGAIVTMNYPDVDFQYVETNPGNDQNKQVVSFNVVSQH